MADKRAVSEVGFTNRPFWVCSYSFLPNHLTINNRQVSTFAKVRSAQKRRVTKKSFSRFLV